MEKTNPDTNKNMLKKSTCYNLLDGKEASVRAFDLLLFDFGSTVADCGIVLQTFWRNRLA